ncbi:VanZ family protein [candidate division KSB1 bacterium]
MKIFIRYYLPVLFWLLFIFVSSYLLRDNSIGKSFMHIDKVVHFIEYGILGFLFVRAFYYSSEKREMSRAVLISFGITVFIAGFDELHQIYVPHRTASFFDFTSDLTGILAAMLVFRFIVRKKNILE